MKKLQNYIEALIFSAEQSLSVADITNALKTNINPELTEEEVLQGIEDLKTKYAGDDYSFEPLEIAGGYQFFTKKEYHATVALSLQQRSKKKLSTSAMETLAMIAYKQPITKAEIENIRGVNCDYSIQKLLEKDLIVISGKSEAPGRPVLYSTSSSFMDYFGLKSVKDLPQLKDVITDTQNEIGEPKE